MTSVTPLWGMTKRLPLRIGSSATKELMYTGKKVSDREALTLDLVNRVVDDEMLTTETQTWAEQIAKNSWHTLREDKRLLNEGLNYLYKDGLQFERKTSLGPDDDMAERLAKFGPKSKKVK
jgi:enoyl-CoA hydratase